MDKEGETFLKTCAKHSDAVVSPLCNEENILVLNLHSALKRDASALHLRSNLCVQKCV